MRAISRAGRWSWALIAGWTVLLLSCPSTVAFWTLSEVKSREVELVSHSWMDCLVAELSLTVAFGTLSEVKRREVELGSQSWMDCLATELSLGSYVSDTVYVTLLRTAVETAANEVHKLLHTGGVPTSLAVLLWRWLTVSSVFTGRSAGTSYS